MNQDVRSAIMDLLRVGVKEYDSTTESHIQRYVLSPKEIHLKINVNKKQKINLSNVYFHLEKLRGKGYIKTVAEIKIKRQIVNYYGRTAKLFLLSGSQKENNDWLSDFFLAINKNFDKNELAKLNNKFQTVFKNSYELRRQWLENNQEILSQSNLDPRNIYKFLTILDSASEPIREILVEFRKLLNYPTDKGQD